MMTSKQVSLAPSLTLPCLVCCETVQLDNKILYRNSAHILSDLFVLFCESIKLKQDGKCSTNHHAFPSFDFTKEPFPFCNSCKVRLVKLFKLKEQQDGIQKEIDSVISCITGKIIESSDQTNTSNKSNPKSKPGAGADTSIRTSCNTENLSTTRTRHKILSLRKTIRSSFQIKVTVDKGASLKNVKPLAKINPETAEQIDCHQLPDFVETVEVVATDVSEDDDTVQHTQLSQGQGSDYDEGGNSDGPDGVTSESDQAEQEDRHSSISLTSTPTVPTKLPRIIAKNPNLFCYAENFFFVKLDENLFGCKTCDGSYETRKKCIDHIRRKHFYPSRYTCEPCGKTFPEKFNLTEHNRTHHQSAVPGPGFSCSKCESTFKNYSSLYFHNNYHNCAKDYQFECGEEGCHKRFYSAAILEQHKQVHSKAFACTKCPRRFGYKRVLTTHMNLVHSQNMKQFPCLECGKNFFRKRHLYDHVQRVHVHPKKPKEVSAGAVAKKRPEETKQVPTIESQCDTCGKTFTSMYLLRIHQEGHVKTPTCSECHRTYATVKNLRDHRRYFHGLRTEKFPCDICGQIFQKIGRLKEHKAGHERDRGVQGDHACKDCGLTFPFEYLLEKHAIKHTEMFKCHICGLSYTTQKYLNTHLKFHGAPALRKFRCSRCDKQFVEKGFLNRHVKLGKCGSTNKNEEKTISRGPGRKGLESNQSA